jgi:hypothetical protein
MAAKGDVAFVAGKENGSITALLGCDVRFLSLSTLDPAQAFRTKICERARGYRATF